MRMGSTMIPVASRMRSVRAATQVNVMSGVRLSRHYFPKMLSSGWGRVIFVASESGVDGVICP